MESISSLLNTPIVEELYIPLTRSICYHRIRSVDEIHHDRMKNELTHKRLGYRQ
jgi:hypothetical protein